MAFGPWPLSIFYTKIRKKKKNKIKQFGTRYLLVYKMPILKFGKNFAGDGKIAASIGN